MKTRIKRLSNSEGAVRPYPWYCYDVKCLEDSDGKVVAFCTIAGTERIRREIPEEMYNHELKNLDLKNPEKIAEFMSEFGFIETMDDWLEAEKNKPLFYANAYAVADARGVKLSTSEAEEGLIGLAEVIPDGKGSYNFSHATSLDAVIEYLTFIKKCVVISKALLVSDSPKRISELTGIEEDSLIDEIKHSDSFLCWLLSAYSPEIGVTILSEETVDTTLFMPDNAYHGSLMSALAIQIRDLALSTSHYRFCKECNELFIKKRSSHRTSTAREDSEYCCDRCRNRYTQREYRKSPGYKLKQKQKRQSSTDR